MTGLLLKFGGGDCIKWFWSCGGLSGEGHVTFNSLVLSSSETICMFHNVLRERFRDGRTCSRSSIITLSLVGLELRMPLGIKKC